MYYYRIAAVTLRSVSRLRSFEAFACDCCETDMSLTWTTELPPPGKDSVSGTLVHRKLRDGWFFHNSAVEGTGLYVNDDYTQLKLLGEAAESAARIEEWYIRIAVECLLARRGYVSLHAAALELDGEALAFTGPSGVGKSTRARVWMEELGARLISGDRPLIDVRQLELYGVPWDGKEQCFRNIHYPIRAICEIRRSESVCVQEMSFAERRALLMRQCFIPMWDTETATVQITNITRLAADAKIVRVFSSPGQKDVHEIKHMLQDL